MDIEFLQSLLHVIDCGSVAQAGRLQNLTAAAIRQRVSALERELGTALLARAGHTVAATQACRDLMPRARHLVREAVLLREDIDISGLSGTLRIGAISTALTGFIPAALQAMSLQAPKLTPFLKPGASAELYDAVVSAELDGALIVAPPFALPKTVLAMPLRDEPLLFIAPADTAHRGRQTATRSIKQWFEQRAYVRYAVNAWGGRFAQRYITDQRIAPRLLCDLDGLEAITLMVAAGAGVSLIPGWKGLAAFQTRLHTVPIKGHRYRRKVILLMRQSVAATPKMKLFAALLKG